MFLFKQVCQGALQTIMQKTSSFAIDFLDFAMSKSIKNESKRITNRTKIGSGAVPGALGGDLGTILVPGWPKAQKWDQKAAKK